MLRLKRVYDPPAAEDGLRILVDRLWPRGLSKEAAAVDLWLKEIAPSPELRTWFGHDPDRWAEFRRRYRAELEDPDRAAALDRLRREARGNDTVTLLFGARNEAHNHAVMLREILDG